MARYCGRAGFQRRTNNSGRGKTLTVLTRIWLTVPEQVESLRDRALKCLAAANGENRLAVHWAMVVATHPFFFDVATHVGKLLALHGHANRSQIKRRMTESWGDRSTAERTIQDVLKSMAQWGVLKSGPEKGSLVARNPIQVSEELAELLVHGVMLSQGRGRLPEPPGTGPRRLRAPLGRPFGLPLCPGKNGRPLGCFFAVVSAGALLPALVLLMNSPPILRNLRRGTDRAGGGSRCSSCGFHGKRLGGDPALRSASSTRLRSVFTRWG